MHPAFSTHAGAHLHVQHCYDEWCDESARQLLYQPSARS